MMEHVEEQRLDHVVAMMAERDLREARALGMRIQRTATQARAEAAHRLAFGYDALDDAVRVLFEDLERLADPAQVARQNLRIVAGLLLVEMHCDEFEMHRRLRLELAQDIEQRVRVLATRKADHDAIAVLDHVVVGDRLSDLAAQPFGQLAGIDAFGGDGVHRL